MDSNEGGLEKMAQQVVDKTKIVVVVVGFNQKLENSVHYEKLPDPTPTDVGMAVWKAFIKGADFASVRFIKKEA
jgi:hypothetical protein